ncbi:MAG: hypothetical protein EOO38_24500 [Cytophagaceae bacterium]|nr:MAG: hypothetical protein EOO38_24500 [Cytophagaceae bacterium]
MTRIPLLREWVVFDETAPWRRHIDIHRLDRESIHAVLRDTLIPEYRDWLDQHTPGYQVCWFEIIIRNPDEAFAFRMRWGGTQGVPMSPPHAHREPIRI